MENKTQTVASKSEGRLLSGKVAVITGGNKGIGKAIALALAAQGANIAVAARDESANKQTAQELSKLGVESLVLKCDLTEAKQIDSFAEQVESSLGGADILVNNAGVYHTEPVRGHRLNLWNQTLNVNLTAAMQMSSKFMERMIERRWGRVINISSISGKVAEKNGSAYSASKFALIGFTQSLALEVAKYDITVNAVCPGWVLTDMSKSQLTDEFWCLENNIDPAESLEIARLSIPQERFVQPDEVGHLCLYLCSEGARSITGQSINICGGMSLH